MPETRYTEIYEQGTGKLIAKEPYEVSDEELRRETLLERLMTISKKGRANWTIADVKDLLESVIELFFV